MENVTSEHEPETLPEDEFDDYDYDFEAEALDDVLQHEAERLLSVNA
jgi:hypothetical protein